MEKSSKEKGDKFEEFVEELYKLIAENERINANIERNVHLIGEDGTDNQFDVVYEYEHFGTNYRVAIECKKWKNPIQKTQLNDFLQKLTVVGNINGIFISAESEFQDGAKRVSNYNRIKLIKYDEFERFIYGQNEEFLLPDYVTVGDPFWIIMNPKGKNSLEQNLYLDAIYLFESKYFAKEFQSKCLKDKDDIKLVGVSQKHLKEIKALVSKNRVKVKMYNSFAKEDDKEKFHFWDLTDEDLLWYIRK